VQAASQRKSAVPVHRMWTLRTSVRKVKERAVFADLFGHLTINANLAEGYPMTMRVIMRRYFIVAAPNPYKDVALASVSTRRPTSRTFQKTAVCHSTDLWGDEQLYGGCSRLPLAAAANFATPTVQRIIGVLLQILGGQGLGCDHASHRRRRQVQRGAALHTGKCILRKAVD